MTSFAIHLIKKYSTDIYCDEDKPVFTTKTIEKVNCENCLLLKINEAEIKIKKIKKEQFYVNTKNESMIEEQEQLIKQIKNIYLDGKSNDKS